MILEELASDIEKTEQYCLEVLAKAEEMIAGDRFTIFLGVDDGANLQGLVERTKAEVIDISNWSSNRMEEIKYYLKMHPEIKRYVILDDCFRENYESYKEIRKHVVVLDMEKGLQKENLMEACAIMNMQG